MIFAQKLGTIAQAIKFVVAKYKGSYSEHQLLLPSRVQTTD
jgi:hypothetical protein